TLKCQGCGATLVIPPAQVSAECPFCSTPYTLEAGGESRELIQPEGVIPFAIQAAEARANALRWLSDRRFAPGDLDSHSSLAPLRPVYLPFWTFDLEGEVRWTRLAEESEYGQVSFVPEG